MGESKVWFIAMAAWSAGCAGVWAQSWSAAGAVAGAFVALAWLAEEYLG